MRSVPATIEMIRALYSAPVSLPRGGHEYCILGGAGRFARDAGLLPGSECNLTYPVLSDAIRILQALNPTLSYSEAVDRAEAIIDHNDDGHIDRAWELLKSALQR